MKARIGFTALAVGALIAMGTSTAAFAEEAAPVDPTAVVEETAAPETPATEAPAVPAEEEATPEAEAPATATEPEPEPAAPAAVPAEVAPATVVEDSNYPERLSQSWTLPAKWNDPNVVPVYQESIFPQTEGASCGVWNQNDDYLIENASEKDTFNGLFADGVLTKDEDSSIYLSHTFTFTPCPPAPGPANPAGTVTAVCGVATINLSNAGENILTTAFVVYVDGEAVDFIALAAGETTSRTLTYGEDTGTHSVEVRTGPAQGDTEVGAVKVETNCTIPPVTPEPPVVAPPVETPVAAAPVVEVAPAAVQEPSEDRLADTGTELNGGMIAAALLLASGMAFGFVAMIRRRSTSK